MRDKMYLSENDIKLVGVCGGISEFFGFNSSAVRIMFIIATFMFRWTLLLYLALAYLMPNRNIDNL